MRCPDCNKFRSMTALEPDLEALTIEVLDTANPLVLTIIAEVRIALACEECGTEMKESVQRGEVEITVEEHQKQPDNEDECEWLVEDEGVDATSLVVRRKEEHGAEVSYKVTCGCGWHPAMNGGTFETDMIDAASMDELS